jgi:hypothetical protein
MIDNIKLIPTTESEFDDIINDNYIYIDKTEYIYKMITSGPRKFFLARPRRFGKTLFLNSLGNFFRGEEELFRGLSIHSKVKEFEKYPVLELNMAVPAKTPTLMLKSLKERLGLVAQREGLVVKSASANGALTALIESLYDKYHKKVVVLVDEYDKPILDHLANKDMAIKIRSELRDFYMALKTSNKYIRFIFVTGISKFGKTAIHSVLNNLHDISHSQDYAAICGYTIEELRQAYSNRFDDALESLIEKGILPQNSGHEALLEAITAKYDGYSWDGRVKVLNPFSINHFFFSKNLDNYWLETGPSHLIAEAMSRDPLAFLEADKILFNSSKVDTTELEELNPTSVFFQTGYLTIEEIRPKEPKYALRIPNDEIREYYRIGLYDMFSPKLRPELVENLKKKVAKAFLAKDDAGLAAIFSAELAGITYRQYKTVEGKVTSDPLLGEYFFHALIYMFLSTMGFTVNSEVASSRGRSDLDILLPGDNVYVLELKYIPAKDAEKAVALAKAAKKAAALAKAKSSPKSDAKAALAFKAKNASEKAEKELAAFMETEALAAIEQSRNSFQDKKYLNKAKSLTLGGLVVAGRDRVFLKFESIRESS